MVELGKSDTEREGHLRPKSSVVLVSASLKEAGEQQVMIVVRALPPSDSWRMRVSFESRYGMCDLLPSASAAITLPSADSDRLMFLASSNTVPSAPVLLTYKPSTLASGFFSYRDDGATE